MADLIIRTFPFLWSGTRDAVSTYARRGEAGYPMSVTDLKTANRAGPPTPGLLPAGDPEIRDLVDVVRSAWPDFDHWQIIRCYRSCSPCPVEHLCGLARSARGIPQLLVGILLGDNPPRLF